MPDIQLSTRTDAIALIRNEPVQARSTARLAALLDAAAKVVHEIGYERLTTAMVAERAGASIGTVYRYFPDRIAVLQSLAARNAERMTDRVLAELRSEQHQRLGRRAQRRLRPVRRRVPATSPASPRCATATCSTCARRPRSPRTRCSPSRCSRTLVERFGARRSDAARARRSRPRSIASDAIAAHAFVLDPKGSQAYLELGATGDPRAAVGILRLTSSRCQLLRAACKALSYKPL